MTLISQRQYILHCLKKNESKISASFEVEFDSKSLEQPLILLKTLGADEKYVISSSCVALSLPISLREH